MESGHRSRVLMISTLVQCVTVSYNTVSLEAFQHVTGRVMVNTTAVKIYLIALNCKSMKQEREAKRIIERTY